MKTNLVLLAVLFTATIFTACDPETPEEPEGELITTLHFQLQPADSGENVIFTFQDLDGDGGVEPTYTTGNLLANTTYNASVELLNESETPTEDITVEVLEEDEDHQFFFESEQLQITYNDMDENENPVGLQTTVTTTNTGSGSLKITLRHEPIKSAENVASGDITNAGGETDIEVTFEFEIQ